jgi:oxygen-independent coproporphyrinogen III oxidase
MAGIYVHFPFCRKKCHYCNFFSTPSSKHRDVFVPSLLKEIELQKDYIDEEVKTIYFGGGTPSLLNGDEINRIIESVYQNFNVSATPEITMEANPDDINPEKVKQIRLTAVNRFSLGVQSFFAPDLKYLNRTHEEDQSECAIKSLQDGGLTNVNIDLIYGTPSLGMGHWKENLNKSVEFQIPHISAYALTVEPHTNLDVLINKSKLQPVSEAETINQFKYLMGFMKEKGFLYYEISNFCRPGFESQHNSAYWNGTPYLGLGPSAHSYNRISRQWNIANLENYIESINQNKVPFETEILTKDQKYNEYIMTSLRTSRGINTLFVKTEFGTDYFNYLEKTLQKYTDSSWIVIEDTVISLTDEGKLFCDMISSDLFVND